MLLRRFAFPVVCLALLIWMLGILGPDPALARAAAPASPVRASAPATRLIPACVPNPDGTCHLPCWQVPSKYNCDHEDPYASGCVSHGSVTTLTSQDVYVNGVWVMRVEMRYSAVCQARWTRVTPEQSGNYTVEGEIYRGSQGCESKFADAYDTYATTTSTAYPLYTNLLYLPQNDAAGPGCSDGYIVYQSQQRWSNDLIY
jgi:hypothetical protein